MNTSGLAPILASIFAEITTGASPRGGFVLNAGDPGLLASLDGLSAEEASSASHGGATLAAHAAHVSYGLSLMNTWATAGGNPFANARWQDAWKITAVDDARWKEIREALRQEVMLWQEALRSPREAEDIELSGMIGSVAHTAYHLGAMRQIHARIRGPRDPSER
ncbi:MAG: hypothetical protein IPM46_05585 [Flavobacteriales bacterium]|nr:hypothetical protein [Flavobacteriales bacterium]